MMKIPSRKLMLVMGFELLALVAWLTLILAFLLGLATCGVAATYRTPNFIVTTHDAQFAEECGKMAETQRRELAKVWLGRELPQWSQPCPITVQVGASRTSTLHFQIGNGEVYGWRMALYGTRRRILDHILPHEITHTVLVSHFRQRLPRWADEGAATSVEPVSELAKYRGMLIQFLRNRRGIAFNRMFGMIEYPRDVMPLYAQGVTLCDFLLRRGGRRKFVNYLRDGLAGNWDEATASNYGFRDLGELQTEWLASVGTPVSTGYG